MKTEIEEAPPQQEGAFVKEERWVEEAPFAWPEGTTIIVKDGDGALWQWQHNYRQQVGAGAGTLATPTEPDRCRQMPQPNMELSLNPAALLSGPTSASGSASGSGSGSGSGSAPTPAFASAAASAPPPCYGGEVVPIRAEKRVSFSPSSNSSPSMIPRSGSATASTPARLSVPPLSPVLSRTASTPSLPSGMDYGGG